ncbi:MAG TPA: hypothetical protein GXX28_05930 [Firmicutes bacterium]|nr:hypothetical protein [Bacillota bacterium]
MSTNLDRQSREILRRLEVRLKALEEGIARHEARVAELKEIRERVAAERDALLAKAESVPEQVGEPPAASKSGATVSAGRPAAKAGPPPEAEPVREVSGQFWPQASTQAERRPQVVYPWSPGPGEKPSPEQSG